MKLRKHDARVGRRKFLAAAAGGMVAGAGYLYGQKRPELLLPTDTPDEYGFRLMWYNPIAPLDWKTYRLKVGGMVERPASFGLEDLRRFPQESQSSRLKCVLCWSARATWSGFRFGHLMEEVKPRKEALGVRIDCADGWFEYMSLEEMTSPRVMMVLSMEGKPLPDRHGGPLRLIDPSKYGYKSAKLITSITFVEEGQGSMACDIGPYYTPEGDIQGGYDHPLDLGRNVRKKIDGGEITEY